MALGFVSHFLMRGRLWNILEHGRGDERRGGEGRAPRWSGVLWAHVGPPIGPGGGARLGPLLRTENSGGGVFVGNCGVGFFYFSFWGVARKWSGMRTGRPLVSLRAYQCHPE